MPQRQYYTENYLNTRKKMKSRFLDFRDLTQNKSKIYGVLNKKGQYLGFVTYYPKWKKHVFSSLESGQVILDSVCLRDILTLCEKLDTEKKNEV